MNDTQATPRQSHLLDLLANGPSTRSQIQSELEKRYPISKATLMRDIGSLTKAGLIKSSGNGKATKYTLLQSRLLSPVDLSEYFREGSTIRKPGPKHFNFYIFDLLGEIFTKKEVEIWEKKVIPLSSKKKILDPSIYKRELERFTVEFSWKSSRIEGNTYTLLETEVLIKQMKEAVGRTKYEAIMILNHKAAVDYILAHAEEFKHLTEAKIINLHSILTKDLEVTSGIRDSRVAITGTDFVPLADRQSITLALTMAIELVNSTRFPLAKTLLVLALFSYIQPFVDGNKRTARTLANAVLIANDYYPLSYRNLDEVAYIEAVLLFYETNNLYYLKQIITGQYNFALETYFL